MNVVIEDRGGCRRSMAISVPADAVVADYVSLLRAYTTQARIPGFRQGKAPAALVEKKFANQLAEDAKERLVPKFYAEAIEKESIKSVGVLGVNNVLFSKDSGLTFDVDLDVAPEFKTPKYKKLSLSRKSVEVSDEDVQRSLDELRGRRARFEDVEDRAAQMDDLVQVDYNGTIDGQPLGEKVASCQDLGTGNDFWVPLALDNEFLPGFNVALTGKSVGDTVTLDVDFPADYHVADVAGQKAAYTVTLKLIRTRILPEIDEEFLKSFEMESEEALRTRIKEDMVASAVQSSEAGLRDDAARQLLDTASFEAPQSLVERERTAMLRDMIGRAMRQGATREVLDQQQTEMVAHAETASVDRVRLSYIMDVIAENESVTVEDSDVDARIEAMSAQYGMPPEQFRTQLEEREGSIEGIKEELRAQKVMDFVIENAKIKAA
jgi:trigger factor